MLGDFKSEYKAIQFIMDIYNLSIKESQWSIEKKANAIPLALDGGLRQPEAEVCAILALWERGNQKTDTNICYGIILFSYASIERNC